MDDSMSMVCVSDNKTLKIRLTEEQPARWSRAAEYRRQTLVELIHNVVSREVGHVERQAQQET